MEAQRLLAKFVNYPVNKWFTTELKNIARDLRSLLLTASAVQSGGIITAGTTVSASVLQVTTAAATVTKLNGVLKADIAAQTDSDLFATSGAIGQAVFADGADASGISLATDETAYVTVIAVDSDGAGGASGDNGAALLVAVVAGAAATYENQTAFLTDAEIRSALLASTGVHDGTTGFARLANILWDENSASPTTTITVARDA